MHRAKKGRSAFYLHAGLPFSFMYTTAQQIFLANADAADADEQEAEVRLLLDEI